MKIIKLLIFSASIFILTNCRNEDKPKPVNTVDSITITSVSPTTGLINGKSMLFHVKGEYNLYSHATGIIMIGFNNGIDIDNFIMDPSKEKVIEKGEGQFEIDVTTAVKDWGTKGTFSAYVNISENPKPTSSWKPYVNAYYKLPIK